MTLNTAIIGLGGAGHNQHIPAVEAHPGLELAAVCDKDRERARWVHTTSATDALWADSVEQLMELSVESVHVCTPPHTRAEITEQVAPHVDGILYEKPFSRSVADGKRVKRLLDEHDVTASVVHNKLFTPYFEDALARVDAGEIGDVHHVAVSEGGGGDPYDSHRGDWVHDLPGAEIGEGWPHHAYRAGAFLDGQLAPVGSWEYTTGDTTGGYDAVVMQAESSTGQSVTIAVHRHAVPHDRVVVTGAKGRIVVDAALQRAFADSTRGANPIGVVVEGFAGAMQRVDAVMDNAVQYLARSVAGLAGHPYAESANSHYRLIDRYAAAVTGDGPVPATVDDGIEAVWLMNALPEHQSEQDRFEAMIEQNNAGFLE